MVSVTTTARLMSIAARSYTNEFAPPSACTADWTRRWMTHARHERPMSGGDERHGTSVQVLLPEYAMVQAALKITWDLAQQGTSIFFIGWRPEVFARPRQTRTSS